MKVSSKLSLGLAVLVSILGGVALAAYDLDTLHRGITASREIAQAVAKGLGGTASELTVTVSPSLCLGLIPLGPVENPYLVVAVGDFILGTLVTGCAILLVYALRAALRRSPSAGSSDEKSTSTGQSASGG
jgi:hypothetical protein